MKQKWVILPATIVILLLGIYVYKSNIASLTETSSKDVIDSKDSVQIVYFERPTCQSCKELTPKLEKLVKQKQLSIKYINTDEDVAAVHKYNIEYVPTLVFIKNNKVEYSLSEVSSISEVSKFIDRAKDDAPYLWIYN